MLRILGKMVYRYLRFPAGAEKKVVFYHCALQGLSGMKSGRECGVSMG
jgi:hypothetical protein